MDLWRPTSAYIFFRVSDDHIKLDLLSDYYSDDWSQAKITSLEVTHEGSHIRDA